MNHDGQFVFRRTRDQLPLRVVRGRFPQLLPHEHAPPWIHTGPAEEQFDITSATQNLCADICRSCPEFQHIDTARVLFTFTQSRNQRKYGLQARVTPMRFEGGEMQRTIRGKVYQPQRYVIDGQEVLYMFTLSLPRMLSQTFEEKMITLFHELWHIGPNFDGDLRRHGGRCTIHTGSKKKYDEHMAALARQYLANGGHDRLHGFLRLSFAQLVTRHAVVFGVKLPRVKLFPVPPTASLV